MRLIELFQDIFMVRNIISVVPSLYVLILGMLSVIFCLDLCGNSLYLDPCNVLS